MGAPIKITSAKHSFFRQPIRMLPAKHRDPSFMHTASSLLFISSIHRPTNQNAVRKTHRGNHPPCMQCSHAVSSLLFTVQHTVGIQSKLGPQHTQTGVINTFTACIRSVPFLQSCIQSSRVPSFTATSHVVRASLTDCALRA